PVTVLDNYSFGGEALLPLAGDPKLTIVVGDLRDPGAVKTALLGARGVVHLAAIVGDPACAAQAELAEAINWTSAVSLYEQAKKTKGLERFVFASTCSNYGKMSGDGYVSEISPLTPVSLYARLKV